MPPTPSPQSGLPRNLAAALAHPWTWRMAWRDSRTQRRRLAMFALAIVSGIAALVAIHALKATLETGIYSQAKALLGSDLEITARQPFPDDVDRIISSRAVRASRETSFSSMLFFPTANAARLVLIRGLEVGFPFYGKVETQPPTAWRELPSLPGIIMEPALLDQFRAKIGDKVRLGNIDLTILGVIAKAAPRAGRFGSFAPEAYVRLEDLELTGLLGKSSLAYYHLHLQGIGGKSVKELRDTYGGRGWRFETPKNRREALGNALENIQRFLGVIAMAALVLGVLGVAGAVHSHVSRRIPAVAILRCLGCPGNAAFAVYLVQALTLALLGSLVGAAIGTGLHAVVLAMFRDSLPVPVDDSPPWLVILRTTAVGLAVCGGFALLPLLRIRRVTPGATLRQELWTPDSKRGRWKQTLAVYLLLAVLMTMLARLNTATWLRSFAMTGGLGAAFLILAGLAKGLMWTARRMLKPAWPYLLRQGISNLYRPRNQTLLFVLSLGLGAFLLLTVLLTRGSLLDSINLRKMPDSPNIYLVDVQQDQLGGVRALLKDQKLPFLESAPVVTMRILSIKGVPVRELEKGKDIPKWLLQREYRSTYRDKLTTTETIVAGEWLDHTPKDSASFPVSVESDFAKDVHITVGDQMELDVQGVPITARVTSVRKVDWSRFNLNFFMVFPPGVLEAAPGFHVLTTRVPEGVSSGQLQRLLVEKYPNVSAIDLTLVLTTVRSILDRAGYVIEVLALFTVLAGLPILIGTLLNGRDQRLAESVLLRTLGASSRQVQTILLVEYATLGALSALAGIALAVVAHWALAVWVFEDSPWPQMGPVLLVAGGVTTAAIAAGSLLSRGVCNHPPLEILRKVAG